MSAALHILDGGLAATIQDCGRFGLQRFGVPQSGALDIISLKIANILVGNSPDLAAIEIIGAGLMTQVEADAINIAFAGTASHWTIESGKAALRIPPLRSTIARRGDILRFEPPKGGAVCYIAVEGGFDVAAVLGSASTYRRAELGGFHGRALRAGDHVPLRLRDCGERRAALLDISIAAPRSLRVIRGPNADYFPEAAYKTLFGGAYTVSAASDRMGLRLQGPVLERAIHDELPSQGTTAGGMQVPADGQPIMLLADRQTTGGYPCIATVIGADIPAAGRLAAGMTIRFEEVALDEAVRLLEAQRCWLASLGSHLKPAREDALSAERLLSANLIDGVTAGYHEN